MILICNYRNIFIKHVNIIRCKLTLLYVENAVNMTCNSNAKETIQVPI